MSIIIGDKVVMVNEMDGMSLIGETFEVAGIVDGSIILCDPANDTCICAVKIEEFDSYFKKPGNIKGWTKWSYMKDADGNIFAFYRYRPEKGKVEVKLADGETMLNKSHGVRCSATCSQGDIFNLEFGVRLALQRCYKKHHERNAKMLMESAEYYKSLAADCKNKNNAMIADWYGEYVKERGNM